MLFGPHVQVIGSFNYLSCDFKNLLAMNIKKSKIILKKKLCPKNWKNFLIARIYDKIKTSTDFALRSKKQLVFPTFHELDYMLNELFQ